MAQTVTMMHLTTEELIELIREAVLKQQCPPCEEVKTIREDLLTRKQASELLNISYTTLHTWNKEGVLPQMKIKGRVYYSRENVMNRIKFAA